MTQPLKLASDSILKSRFQCSSQNKTWSISAILGLHVLVIWFLDCALLQLIFLNRQLASFAKDKQDHIRNPAAYLQLVSLKAKHTGLSVFFTSADGPRAYAVRRVGPWVRSLLASQFCVVSCKWWTNNWIDQQANACNEPCFFPRASERRVLLIVEVCHHIFS